MPDPASDLDDAHDRENADAASPPRRTWRRWWPLLLLLLVPVIALVSLQGEDPPPPPPPPPPPAIELPPPPPPPEPLPVEPAPVDAPKPKPKADKPKPAATPKPAPASTAGGSTISVGGATGGAVHVRQAMERALRKTLGTSEGGASSGYSAMLTVETKAANENEVTVRCAVSIALLPKKNVVASLKARADAAGEGTPTDELFDDAAAACGTDLGTEIRRWLKTH